MWAVRKQHTWMHSTCRSIELYKQYVWLWFCFFQKSWHELPFPHTYHTQHTESQHIMPPMRWTAASPKFWQGSKQTFSYMKRSTTCPRTIYHLTWGFPRHIVPWTPSSLWVSWGVETFLGPCRFTALSLCSSAIPTLQIAAHTTHKHAMIQAFMVHILMPHPQACHSHPFVKLQRQVGWKTFAALFCQLLWSFLWLPVHHRLPEG